MSRYRDIELTYPGHIEEASEEIDMFKNSEDDEKHDLEINI
jgi:hypothetical protein